MPKNPVPPPSWCKPTKPKGKAWSDDGSDDGSNAENAVASSLPPSFAAGKGISGCLKEGAGCALDDTSTPCCKPAKCYPPGVAPVPGHPAKRGNCWKYPPPVPASTPVAQAAPAVLSSSCSGTLVPGLDEGVGLSFNTLKGTARSKFPVFGYTCDEEQTWREPVNGTLYSVPDQLTVRSAPSATFDMSSKVFKSIEAFESSEADWSSFSFGFPGVRFWWWVCVL